MSRSLALIVGINQYQDTTFQSLHFAEQDARALAQWLVNERGGKWSPTDVQFVQGSYATHTLIETLITQLCLAQAGPDDLVLLYFAGHAFIDEQSGVGCLALADSYHTHAQTALQLAPLAQKIMLQSNAGRILFFLDAFQSGPHWSMRRSSPFDMQPLLGTPMLQGLAHLHNRIVLCSCRGNELAAESGDQGLGQLMLRMIIGLSGQARDPMTGDVSLQSLTGYLSNKLGPQQRPQLFGQAPGPFTLVGAGSSAEANTGASQTIPVTPSATHDGPQASAPAMNHPPEASPFGNQRAMKESAYTATATAQLSPSAYAEFQPARATSGQLAPAITEQQQSQPYVEYAKQALQAQQPYEALQCLNQALQMNAHDLPAVTLKAQILGTMGHTQEALTTIDYLIQHDSTNALAWSMRAVILTNTGNHQEALKAIEHSLELDASNAESYSIKTNIMENLAIQQSQEKGSNRNSLIKSDRQRTSPKSFFLASGLSILGILMGIVGGVLPILRPTLPIALAFLLEGFGLALLCVNATRGTYRHGIIHLIPTIFTSLLLSAILALSFGYRTVYTKIIYELQAHTNFLLPVLFLAVWLALAAVLPFVLALIGLVVRLVTGRYRKRA